MVFMTSHQIYHMHTHIYTYIYIYMYIWRHNYHASNNKQVWETVVRELQKVRLQLRIARWRQNT